MVQILSPTERTENKTRGGISKTGRFYPFNYLKGDELTRKLRVRNFFLMRIIGQRIDSLRKRDSEVAGYKVTIIQNSITFL